MAVVTAFQPEIAMSTCDRDPQYVHETLTSMFEMDAGARERSVRLVVCGEDDGYLGRWKGLPNIATRVVRPPEIGTLTQPPIQRTTFNFMRVLEGDGDLIALQDDLSFAPGWLEAAERLCRQVRERHGDLFIVALYAAYRMKGRPLAPYNPFRFYGNQALCFSAAARAELQERMQKTDKIEPDDMMVKNYAIYSSCRVFMANPNLVQHIGKTSAINQRFHKSPTFKW